MKMRRLSALLACCLLPLAAHSSSTFRCSSKLVSLQASTYEVLSKCGEPSARSVLGESERLDEYGQRIIVTLEEWTYGPNNGMYHFLRFEGDRLSAIRSKRHQ